MLSKDEWADALTNPVQRWMRHNRSHVMYGVVFFCYYSVYVVLREWYIQHWLIEFNPYSQCPANFATLNLQRTALRWYKNANAPGGTMITAMITDRMGATLRLTANDRQRYATIGGVRTYQSLVMAGRDINLITSAEQFRVDYRAAVEEMAREMRYKVYIKRRNIMIANERATKSWLSSVLNRRSKA